MLRIVLLLPHSQTHSLRIVLMCSIKKECNWILDLLITYVFFFSFLHVHSREGRGIWISDICFIKRGLQLGVGTGQLQRVLGFLATWPDTNGFEKTQPTTWIKTIKSAKFRVGQGGLSWTQFSHFFDSLHLLRFHFLQIDKPTNKSLPSISLKPTNPTLTPPSPSNPQIDKPTNSHKPKPIRKEERMRERERETPFKPLAQVGEELAGVVRLARETRESEIVRDGDGDRAEREVTQAKGSREREREKVRGEGGRRRLLK